MPDERRIRSFTLRESRLTAAQRRALVTLWERFGATGEALLDLDALFGRSAARILEIGFGNGESLAFQAQTQPEVDFLGIEVYRPGIGHLLLQAERLGLTHLKVICADAVTVLERQLPDACLDRIQIFFPDPWPKRRHHKRRLIQPSIAALLARKLKVGGYLHLATDWEDYARWSLAVLEATVGFRNCAEGGGFAPRPAERPLTKFEARGQRLNHAVWDLLFERV